MELTIVKATLLTKLKRSRYVGKVKEIKKVLESSVIVYDGNEYKFKDDTKRCKILNLYCEAFHIEFKNSPPDIIVYHIDVPRLENKGAKDNFINFHIRETDLEKKSKYIIYFRFDFTCPELPEIGKSKAK